MKIVLQKDKVSYINLVKILLIGHAVGFSVLALPILVLGFLVNLLSESEPAGPDILLGFVLLPVILVGQAFMLALLYRLGFWFYGLVKPIRIEVSE